VTHRVVFLVVMVVLAGCSGAPVDDSESTPTVTPAPVPNGTASAEHTDGAAVVDGAKRGRAHALTLSLPHTRTHDLQISRNGVVLLEYRETSTVWSGTGTRLRRTYSGPLTARFVPYVENASTAQEERYVDAEGFGRRQTVDGVERERSANGPPALVAPLLITDDGALVEAALDGGRVVERTRSLGARLAHDRVHSRVVPQFLEDPRSGTVSAMIRADGRVTRLAVRYEATLDGDPVVVEGTIRWDRPTEPLEPDWADE
jgi:hypothetical protein